MFEINTNVRQKAVNYAALLNALNCSERRLEQIFNKFAKLEDVSIPIIDSRMYNDYVQFFEIEPSTLKQEYYNAYKAIYNLRNTDEIIKRGNQDYPSLLVQTDQAPRFLYIRGNKSLLRETRVVAVVGSREASERAKSNTARLVRFLGNNGIIVISGLAKGIDVTAHRAALENGYNTISVIGTNLNQYYPKVNESVQREIEDKCIVVSQFSPANKTQKWFFPLRNGVMSGMSLATVIMEAGEKSGALKQADYALKQGRQVLISATALKDQQLTWPAKYIQRGAQVVQSPSDVLRKLEENNILEIIKENS